MGHIPVRTARLHRVARSETWLIQRGPLLAIIHTGLGWGTADPCQSSWRTRGKGMISVSRFCFWLMECGNKSVLVKKWSVAITGSTVSSDPRFAGYSHLMLRFHSFPALLHGWYSVYGQNELIIPPTAPSATGTRIWNSQSTTSVMTGCTSW